MTYANPDALVSTEWLAQHMDAPDVRVVDATYFLPNVDRNAREEYAACHIPGAVFFDIDDVCDSDNPLPHMMPPAEKFTSRVRKMGLGNGNRVVVYDNGGGMAGCRVWWMFRVFGHDDVAVLDGGLAKWLAEERPVEDMAPAPRERHFASREDHTLVRTVDQILDNVESGKELVVDVRAAGRFNGTAPEPREGMRSGHIPGAVNLPYEKVLDLDNHRVFRPADEIAAEVEAAGIDLDQPIVASCGSGVSAAVLALGLYLIGHERAAVYDGSWTEWGGREDTPITKD